MLASSVTLRRRKASRENQAACFGPDAESCPFFFGALEVVLPIK
jgi:hypothetical protein